MEELQLTIRAASAASLGDLEQVRATLDSLLPGIVWDWTSSGMDRLAEADARGFQLPPTVWRIMESQPSVLCGEVETSGVTATFNLGPGGEVPAIWTTLGGDRAAVQAVLSRLRGLRGWSIEPGEGWLITEMD